MIDQSHINDGHEVLIVSVRMRDRALPVAWRVRKTKGNIGCPIQKELLDSIENWVPEGADVLLKRIGFMARKSWFTGTKKLDGATVFA